MLLLFVVSQTRHGFCCTWNPASFVRKLELMGEDVCQRWHRDFYCGRAIITYNLRGTEYTSEVRRWFRDHGPWPSPKKLRCWKRGHAKRKCVSFNHQFSGDVQYVNWGGFGWKVSRKSSDPSPKFNGWSRWNLCRSNMFKNPTFVGPSRATKKVRISQRNPFLSRWFKPFFCVGNVCYFRERIEFIPNILPECLDVYEWSIYMIYTVYIYIYIIHIFQKWMISGRCASFSKPSFWGEIDMVLRTLGDLPPSPCSVPSRRTWTIGSWKTAVTGFCVCVCCFVGEKNQWMSWMSRFWAALAKSPLVAEKEKRWFCGTTFFLLCLTGTFIRTRLWSHITV